MSVAPVLDEAQQKAALAQIHRALNTITGRWKLEILLQLLGRTHRFGELRRSLPGITQHMLTTQLRELEVDGLVNRTVFAEVPLRVEYEITARALRLRPVLDALLEWCEESPAAGAEETGEASVGKTASVGKKAAASKSNGERQPK